MTRIRLTRKLADRLNGVDLSGRRVGDIFDLRSDAASVLIDEGWAVVWIKPAPARAPAAKSQQDR